VYSIYGLTSYVLYKMMLRTGDAKLKRWLRSARLHI